MRTGKYDGVSARGDVSGRLVADRLASPINTDLISSYSQLFPTIKHLPDNMVDGITYGVPIGRLAESVRLEAESGVDSQGRARLLDVIFDPSVASRYRGGVTAYDNPMYIADAALYLRHHQPDLGIHDVYELDRRQFNAAVEVLREQRANVSLYWKDSSENAGGFESGRSLVGPAWQVTVNTLLKDRVKVSAGIPEEGVTGISDNWMISSHARHPNCMYMWISYVTGAPRTRRLQSTPRRPGALNEHACDLTQDPAWCDTYRAADEELFGRVTYWATPLHDCGDARGATCTTYDDWSRAFGRVTSGK